MNRPRAPRPLALATSFASFAPVAALALPLVAVGCEGPAPATPAAVAPVPPAIAASAAPASVAPPVLDQDFLRLYTESRGFSRGAPRSARLTPDGHAVLYLRSEARDKKQSLYEMDVATGVAKRLLAPEALDTTPEQLTAEERARRERLRITANGFTAFTMSKDGKTLVLSLSGKLYVLDRPTGTTHRLETGKGAVVDPRLSPDGTMVAYVQDDDIHVIPVAAHGAAGPAGAARALTRGGSEDRPHGLPDFAAAEELDRYRGYFWSPDSKAILYEEADASKLPHFTIADPASPERPADRVAYPRAGTINATLRFGITRVAAPFATTWVEWDRDRLVYVSDVTWDEGAPPTLTALDRLQKDESLLVVDPATGKTREVAHEHDEAWVNTGGKGVPRWMPDGSGFLWWSERDGDGRVGLVQAGKGETRWLSPAGMQVTGVLDLDPKARLAVLETTRDGLHYEVTGVSLDGGEPRTIAKIDDGRVFGSFDEAHDVFLADEGSLSGVHRLVVRSIDAASSASSAKEVPSVAATPPLPKIESLDLGPDHVHAALVRPRSYVAGARYPLIDSAYAGPHAQVVDLDARSMVFEQWMADATGAVVVSLDAKGTPGRGRAWERALAGKLGDVPLDGHVQAIQALLASHPELDPARVGVYGWSFGGYFSALAVLRRPDVYAAAVAIAPVTDWRNYDTAYTERYLGLPDASAAAYDQGSVVMAAGAPPAVPRADGRAPSLLIAHGTADDNVYFFNSLQLVDALAKAGRPFVFLPMTGQTHQMASPEAEAAVWLAAARSLQVALAPSPRP